MAKNLNMSLLIKPLRRAYGVVADNVKAETTSSMARKVADSAISKDNNTKENIGKHVFWMRDPKTGNWIPENHFGEVDAAELREKLLSKKPNFS